MLSDCMNICGHAVEPVNIFRGGEVATEPSGCARQLWLVLILRRSFDVAQHFSVSNNYYRSITNSVSLSPFIFSHEYFY